MKHLLSFSILRKLTAALAMALRVAQSPFTSVAWWLESVASNLETALAVARLNNVDDL